MHTISTGGSIRSRIRAFTLLLVAFAFPLQEAVSQEGSEDGVPSIVAQVKVHAGLYELYTWDDDGSVWVAAVGSSLVPGARLVQLDGQTLAELNSIDVEEAPGFGLAINSQTDMLYTSNTREGSMSAVNLRTGEITHITDPNADGEPHLYRVVVDEENNMVYASVAQTPGQIWAVDGSTNTLDRVIDSGGARPTGLIVDPSTNRLYTSNMGDDLVSVIDLSNDRIVDRIPTAGGRSTRLGFDPATQRLFVGNQTSNDISVIDLNEMRAVKRVAVGERPVGVAFHPMANQIYVANRMSGTVSVIDAETYETVTEIEIGSYPNTIHVDDSTGLVYVSNKATRGAPRGEDPRIDPQGDMVTVIRP